MGHWCSQGCSQGCQNPFLMIFDGFWVPSWCQFWVIFWDILCFGVTKCWSTLQPYSLMDFEWKIISFPMSQPLKNIVNTMVFMRFHFFNNFHNLKVSGTILETILEALGRLERPFSWFLEALVIAWNFNEFQGLLWGTQIESTQSGGGKMFLPRAHYYRQYGGYSIQNVTYSMEHGTWRLKGITNCRLNHMPHSLMAPGKQGPADIYIYICIFIFM